MSRKIEIVFLPGAEQFIEMVGVSARKKLFFALRKVKLRMYGEWFKKLKGTKDIFEVRIKDNNRFFRLFAFWDHSGETRTLVVCTHGFIKKTDKTPRREIEKAERIKENYFRGLL